MPQITVTLVTHGPGAGEWHYRVHTSPSEDWSGSANSMDEAWLRAKRKWAALRGEGA